LSSTAIAELTTGSDTPPSDSTYLRATMLYKPGTALILRDISKRLLVVMFANVINLIQNMFLFEPVFASSGEGGGNTLSCPYLWRAACFAVATAESF